MRHVIIGGSIAGISAAKAIRGSDAQAEITMIAAENVKPYYRPMIPMVIGKEDVDIAFDDNPIEKYGIKTVYEQATGIAVRTKEVMLASGRRVPYDRLLIATGSSPLIPDVPGLQGVGVFPLRTLEDARSIHSAARGGKHAVVLGGGFVGIKAAGALRHAGLAVTIIEKLDRILYEKLDKRGAEIIADLLKRKDIDIVTNQSAYEIIRAASAVTSVGLSSGRTIEADMVVIAIGTRPNTDAFKDTGIKINKGIVIQESLQTSIPDVYAAGDVVEYRDIVSNAYSVSALWANAQDMGRLAGKNMAGASFTYKGFLALMNTTEIMNVPVTTIGMVESVNGGYETFIEDSGDSYRKLVFKNDVMAGALFIGDIGITGIYTYLIKNQIPLGKLKGLAVKGNLRYINFMNPSSAPVS